MAGSRIPAINWSANEGELISKLITELEKIENFRVFLGKKDKYDVSNMSFSTHLSTVDMSLKNTSGDSKAKVAKRMGQAILPELYKIDPKVVGDRMKGKIDAYALSFCLKWLPAEHISMKACFRVPETREAASEDRGWCQQPR